MGSGAPYLSESMLECGCGMPRNCLVGKYPGLDQFEDGFF